MCEIIYVHNYVYDISQEHIYIMYYMCMCNKYKYIGLHVYIICILTSIIQTFIYV